MAVTLSKMSGIKEIINEQNTIIWVCAAPDGFGDIEHFIDLANPQSISNQPQFNGYLHVRMLMCAEEHLQKLEQKLIQANMQDTLIFSYNKDSANKVPEQILKVFHERKLVSKIALIFNISTPLFAIILREYIKLPLSIPIIHITEHGASSYLQGKHDPVIKGLIAASQCWAMGFANDQYDVILKPEIRTSSQLSVESSKVQSLCKIKDLGFLKQLFHNFCKTQHREFDVNQEIAAEFLQHTVLIPCYAQSNEQAFTALLMGICFSELVQSSRYKEIIFSVNEGNVNLFLIAKAFSQKKDIQIKNIHSLEISSYSQEGTQAKKIKSETIKLCGFGIKVKIIQGYYLSDSDHNAFFETAQLLRIVSGDKSLEKSLMSDAVAIYLARNYKMDVLYGLKNVLCSLDPSYHYPIFDTLHQTHNIIDMEDLLGTANNIANALTKELQDHWSKTMTEFRKKYNFNDRWHGIIEHSFMFAELCRLESKENSGNITDQDNHKEIVLLKQKIEKIKQELNSFKEAQFQSLINHLIKHRPESLDISFDYFTSAQFKMICSIVPKMNNLKFLKVSSNLKTFKINFPDFLKAILKHPTLEILYCDNNNVDDKDIGSLLEVLKTIPSLASVNLNSNHITHVVPIIQFMQRHNRLSNVSLANNPLESTQSEIWSRISFPIRSYSIHKLSIQTKALLGFIERPPVVVQSQTAIDQAVKPVESSHMHETASEQLPPLIYSYGSRIKGSTHQEQRCEISHQYFGSQLATKCFDYLSFAFSACKRTVNTKCCGRSKNH